MHVLTLVVSFTYSIPRFHWASRDVGAATRWPYGTVRWLKRPCSFREIKYYDADLMTAFTEHVSRWRHVMSDICHYGHWLSRPLDHRT